MGADGPAKYSDVVALVAAGADAMEVLSCIMENHRNDLLRIVQRFDPNPDHTLHDFLDGFEALLETFRRGGRQAEEFPGYLSLSCRRHALNAMKRLTVHIPLEEAGAGRDTKGEAAHDVLTKVLAGDLLRAAREELSRDDWKVIALRVLQELSYGEIGHRFGIAEGAARVRFHRARLHALDVLTPLMVVYTLADVTDWRRLCAHVITAAERNGASVIGRLWSILPSKAREAIAAGQQGLETEEQRTTVLEAINDVIERYDLLVADQLVQKEAPRVMDGGDKWRHILRNRRALDDALTPHVRRVSWV